MRAQEAPRARQRPHVAAIVVSREELRFEAREPCAHDVGLRPRGAAIAKAHDGAQHVRIVRLGLDAYVAHVRSGGVARSNAWNAGDHERTGIG
jgi:hypothetical protein